MHGNKRTNLKHQIIFSVVVFNDFEVAYSDLQAS